MRKPVNRPSQGMPRTKKTALRAGLPPRWFTVLAMFSGIYAMGTVYRATLAHNWAIALGAFAVLIAVVLVIGTPLAFARYLRWSVTHKKG